MTVISIRVNDFGNHILQRISKLESKLNIKLHLSEKILLLAETGTIEQLLGIFINSETEIKVLKQKETHELIQRKVCITNKKTGEKLMYARSNIFPTYLP